MMQSEKVMKQAKVLYSNCGSVGEGLLGEVGCELAEGKKPDSCGQ